MPEINASTGRRYVQESPGKRSSRFYYFLLSMSLCFSVGRVCKSRRRKILGESWFPVFNASPVVFTSEVHPTVSTAFPAYGTTFSTTAK
jgi:hypothetical protein